MITGFAIILEDDIIYCSNDDIYSTFEIVLFIEKLLKAFNPIQSWRLNNILFEGNNKKRMIIKHFVSKMNKDLFFCIIGGFKEGSQESRNLIDEFYDKVNIYYRNTDILNECSRKPVFKEILKIMITHLKEKYISILENEIPEQKFNSKINNRILYCGISSQGLPIISQLYDKTLLNNLNIDINEENVGLFNSNLSAHLATIEMNTIIRSRTKVKEIQIVDTKDIKNKKIILFEEIYNFSLNLFATGNFYKIRLIFEQLKENISKENILQKDFLGDLKAYKYLSEFLSELEENF